MTTTLALDPLRESPITRCGGRSLAYRAVAETSTEAGLVPAAFTARMTK